MKSKQSFEQCCNGRAVVEEGHQLIVAQQVRRNAADKESLAPLLDQVKRNTGRKPRRVLADAGYQGEKNCQVMRIALSNATLRRYGFVMPSDLAAQSPSPDPIAGFPTLSC